MTTRTAALEADLDTAPSIAGAHTVVALPPSSIDPVSDEMRVMVNGTLIYRAFDPGAVIVTGAPIALVTMSGEALVTMTGDEYVTVVA